MTTINLNDSSAYPSIIPARSAQVWTKARWADPFVLRPDMTPVQSVWSLAPEVSTAALEYRYGRVLVPGASQYQTLARITARGYWVLIRWFADNGSPIDWLGYAETPITREHFPPRDSLPETGFQSVPCFGLMRALEQCLVDTTVYVHPTDSAKAKRSGGTGSTFNEGMKGNRSQSKRSLDPSDIEAYVFTSPNDPDAQWWSTRDIVEHLAAFHLPTAESVPTSGGVPWQVNNLAVLPDWDRPSIDSDVQSVASILIELINPSKLLSWGIGFTAAPSSTPTVSAVTINPFSLLASPLSLPVGTLPANPLQFAISGEFDPLTEIVVDDDASGVVDQLIVQGPREISVTTLFGHPENKSPFEKGWTLDDEDEYIEGAKAWPGFAGGTVDEQRRSNKLFRTTGKMVDVYQLYRLKDDWDGLINDNPMFQPDTDSGSPVTYIPSPIGIEILDYLPLFSEVDYSVPAADVDESAGLSLRMPLFSLRRRNDAGTIEEFRMYVDARGELTLDDERLKSRPIELEYEIDQKLNVRLIVRDAPQHAIAGKEFIGNNGDLDQETTFGNLFHAGWEITVAIRGDRRPRWRIPNDVSNLDVVRRKVITLEDDSLASVWITKDAIVGFANNTDVPKKAPGGLVRDPLPILRSICELLAKQHTQPRRRATIRTARRLPQLSLGHLVTTIDVATGPVEAVVSQIRIDAPSSSGGSPPRSSSQTFIVSPYQSDVLSLLRTPAGRVPIRAKRRKFGEKRVIKPRSERRPLVPRDERMTQKGKR